MVDPKEIKKGGFGAFAALDRERRAAREAAAQHAANPAPTPVAVPDASGTGAAAATSQEHRAEKTTELPPDAITPAAGAD